jgi:hypothetical protein
MNPTRFWITSILAALVLGALVSVGFPFDLLGLEAGMERRRAWLLTVWTLGVMSVCFGASGLAATLSPISVRDIAERGSVAAAIEARRGSRRDRSESPFYNFAGWITVTGFFLLLIYFAGWLLLDR